MVNTVCARALRLAICARSLRTAGPLLPLRRLLLSAAIFALSTSSRFAPVSYRRLLDPSSSTGSFESAIAQFKAFRGERRTRRAWCSAIRASTPGSIRSRGERDRAEPCAFSTGVFRARRRAAGRSSCARSTRLSNRYRAIVIAVDTYADDDSAIGSLDGDDRPMDLRYVVFQTRLSDLPKLAGSFSDPRERVEHGIDLFLRGPELRDDFQALAADPLARVVRAIEQARGNRPTLRSRRIRAARVLDGLLVNFSTACDHLSVRLIGRRARRDCDAGAARSQAEPVVRALSRAVARADRRTLRRRGRARDLRAHPDAARAPLRSRSAQRLARWRSRANTRARLIPAEKYIALERPELFADEDHLNRDGSLRFSRLLGADVTQGARRLRSRPSPCKRPGNCDTARSAASRAVVVRRGRGHRHPAAFTVVRVLALLRDRRGAVLLAVPRRARRYVLLVASYYFYARWNAWYVLFLWILTASDFAIAIALERARDAGRNRAAAARARRRRESRIPRQLQVYELRERHGRGADRHASKSVARQSLRPDRHQLSHVSEHLVSGRRLSGEDGGGAQAARLRALSGVLSAAAGGADRARGTLLRRARSRGGRPARTTSATGSRARASGW